MKLWPERTLESVQRWCADFRAHWREWVGEDGPWYLVSFLFHAVLVLALGILSASLPRTVPRSTAAGIALRGADPFDPVPALQRFEVGKTPLNPSELNAQTLTLFKYEPPAQTAMFIDRSEVFVESGGGTQRVKRGPDLGGLGGFSVPNRPGPSGGQGGVGHGVGQSDHAGSGGIGEGFGRGAGARAAAAGMGMTRASERAVAAALNWLAHHQFPAGNWSLQFARRCNSAAGCSGPGVVRSDCAATGMGLLPFLAAGLTHQSSGPYRQVITNGVFWLVKHQSSNGDLTAGSEQRMYSQAIATIALCEAYGMSQDSRLRGPAQAAVRFIEQAQNEATGGWRYEPGDRGDTSVTGWEMMALHSGQVAGLAVDAIVVENTRKWFRQVAKGQYQGLYSYQPFREPTPTMTAVGMLASQYLGTRRGDPAMLEAKDYLLQNLPDNQVLRSTYYWYYGTLAMHNYLGEEWDRWNRKMRRALIETQCRDGCAAGSWDPERPTLDVWGEKGGRLMMTSLAALSLEIYYRYMPLFKLDGEEARSPAFEPVANR